MSEEFTSAMQIFQEDSDEFVSKNFSDDVFNHYQSLIKGSERIPTGLFGSLAEAQIAVGGPSPQDAFKVTSGFVIDNFDSSSDPRAGGLVIDSFNSTKAAISQVTAQEPRAVSKAATRAGKMSESTLQGTMDAASMAIKVMRGRL